MTKRLFMRSVSRRVAILAVLALTLASPETASAFLTAKPVIAAIAKFTKNAKALPDDEVARLANIAGEVRGTKTVGTILGASNLPEEVLEDAYLRIAIQQKKLTRREAEGMFQRLGGVDGLRGTLSKIIGNSDAKTAGHLNELRIADTASQYGFRVRGVGLRFDDGKKAADTDIDVLLEREGVMVAVEAKDYGATTPIPLDSFRADMESLVAFSSARSPQKVIPIFSLTHRPSDPDTWRRLQLETDRRGIQLIDGSPEQQVEQIKVLHEIL